MAALYDTELASPVSSDAVLQSIASADFCHFVGHARVALDSELTRLELPSHKGAITIRGIEQIPRRQRAEFMIAACSARIPSLLVPDEVIGLPGSIVGAGYRRVLSSQWPIGDRVAAVTSIRYHELRIREPAKPAHLVVGEIQSWLRAADNSAIAQWAMELADEFRRQGRPVPELRLLALQHGSEDPRARPFARPWAWAAFTLTGS